VSSDGRPYRDTQSTASKPVVATVRTQLWRRDDKKVGILKRVEARTAQPQFGLAEKIAAIYAGILKIALFYIYIYISDT
jgi:hypothetical protein